MILPNLDKIRALLPAPPPDFSLCILTPVYEGAAAYRYFIIRYSTLNHPQSLPPLDIRICRH